MNSLQAVVRLFEDVVWPEHCPDDPLIVEILEAAYALSPKAIGWDATLGTWRLLVAIQPALSPTALLRGLLHEQAHVVLGHVSKARSSPATWQAWRDRFQSRNTDLAQRLRTLEDGRLSDPQVQARLAHAETEANNWAREELCRWQKAFGGWPMS